MCVLITTWNNIFYLINFILCPAYRKNFYKEGSLVIPRIYDYNILVMGSNLVK